MKSTLKNAMLKVAGKNNIQVRTADATFINLPDNTNSLHLPGATYGFCVRLSPEERDAIFLEAKSYQTNRISSSEEWLPIKENIYPLYWGKDKSLGERIYRHLKNNSEGTGLVRLCAYSSLINKEIACVSLTVTKYTNLESELRNSHADLLKTSSKIL